MTKKITIPEEVKTLGEAIRFLREERGLTLRGLAEKVEISAPFLSDIEHGRRQTDKIELLAHALSVPGEDLKKFDARVTADLKDWLAANPKLVGLLKDMQSSGGPIPLEAIKTAIKNKKS